MVVYAGESVCGQDFVWSIPLMLSFPGPLASLSPAGIFPCISSSRTVGCLSACDQQVTWPIPWAFFWQMCISQLADTLEGLWLFCSPTWPAPCFTWVWLRSHDQPLTEMSVSCDREHDSAGIVCSQMWYIADNRSLQNSVNLHPRCLASIEILYQCITSYVSHRVSWA